jgi:cobalt-zinc-cadmium resistance protein CzcA
MFFKLIDFSVRNKFIIGIFMIAWISSGVWAMLSLPLDAVPDITNNQVQVVTVSPTLAPQEIELRITLPVEQAVSNIPGVIETRSISRYGLSVVTIVFEEKVSSLDARQYVREQLAIAQAEIPEELGTPELMPITTGLGEIYQYTLNVKPGYEKRYDAMYLRTLQDWIVKKRLAGTKGIIEISSFGGFVKQYEIAVDPSLMQNYGITIHEVFHALEANNQNSGGSYIEQGPKAFYIRTEGAVQSKQEIENILIQKIDNFPIQIKHIAKVKFGFPKRYGAMTKDGKGEVIGGITLMLKGASSSEALANVHKRIAEVQKSLPEGITIEPYMDRSILVDKTISTVSKNLIEGGIIVILVLVILLGNFRAGWIVASVIPLSMLFAFLMMHLTGVSANLMSLGAIDFGIVVDGAVIIVESVLHVLYHDHKGKLLSRKEMDTVITNSTASIFRSSAFGVLIILVVFVPIMTLTGIEGKMFGPMAQTISFAIIGAMILSLTYVPVISAMTLNRNIKVKETFSDKLINKLKKGYKPILYFSIKFKKLVLSISIAILIFSFYLFSQMGGEFIPTLEEGDLAMQMSLKPGSSLDESIRTSTMAEKILLENFPEVKHVVSKIGTSEVPTDPMAIEETDIMILLKDKSEWTSATDREELAAKMKEKLSVIKWASFEFSQPIQLRFNELMTGSKADISIKIFGDDMDLLATNAKEVKKLIRNIEGVADVKVEQTEGLTQKVIDYNDTMLAQYGVTVKDLNLVIRTAFAGEKTGVVFENEKRFDLVVRLDSVSRKNVDLEKIMITTSDGQVIPMSYLARVIEKEGPMMISREKANRRINIGVNVRNRDIASTVNEIQNVLEKNLKLPTGYYIHYGGQFENLQAATDRLMIAVPVALLMIFVLLYLAFGSVKYALLIYSAVPLATVGGILALYFRGMPFSISAGVGFIALFGVAVLNGIVLISYLNEMRKTKSYSIKTIAIEGGMSRLRPVLMTAAVASLGFLPMAISSSAGAEVQKPLATVVIGGLITSTLLTLFLLPVLYIMTNQPKKKKAKMKTLLLLLLLIISIPSMSQSTRLEDVKQFALNNHPQMKMADLKIELNENKIKQAFQVDALNFTYTRGQINSEANDYMLEAFQNFGNLRQMTLVKKAIKGSVETEKLKKERLEQEILYSIESVWYSCEYYLSLKNNYEKYIQNYQSLIKKAEKRLESGEIALSELILFRNKLNLYSNEKVKAELYLEKSTKELKQISYWKDTLIFEEMKINNVLVTKNDSSAFKTIFLAPLLKEKENLQQFRKAEKSYMFPQFGIGYFNQQLDLTKGFNGLKAGVSIPIFYGANKSKVKEWEIQEKIIDQTINEQNHQLTEWVYSVENETSLLEKRLLEQDKMNLEFSKFKDVHQLLFEKGENNFLEYIQSTDILLENKISELDTQHQYLQICSQLNFLKK